MICFVFVLTDDEQDSPKSLYKAHNARMYSIAFKILNKPEDAEEAVQEAFLRMAEKIERIFELPCPERVPYCVTIVKNISKNMLRGKKPQVGLADVEYYLADGSADPQAEIFAKEDRELLAQSIESLNPQDKDVVIMRWGKKMHYREIGAILGVGEDTAAKRGQRALNHLRAIYMKRFDNGQLL